ncbi:MAG: tRNA (adenosine(37)-N6)-threonylcarbamoyltransferase complex transferase subunit TsaD, partial [Muribaculaceae bacterium]|nr:tRNA (adenosine(37)-N6)-threonylcarbamoyltransferase complex transferase subunit TsaD [Muribaculaceae bacterium]
LEKAVKIYHPRQIAIGGGVSANSGVRNAISQFCEMRHIKAWIPKRSFTTDNAAMVAIAGAMRFDENYKSDLGLPPYSKTTI